MGKLDIAEAVIEGIGKGGDLAMDFASRMKRAGEQGFDTSRRLFHGTSVPVDGGFYDSGVGMGTHLGTAEQASNRLSQVAGSSGRTFNQGDQVLPLMTSAKNPLRMGDVTFEDSQDMFAHLLKRDSGLDKAAKDRLRIARADMRAARRDAGFNSSSDNFEWIDSEANEMALADIKDELERAGYDSIVYANAHEGAGDSLVVLDPANIRSTNAAFDPANAGKNDLLGAATPSRLAATAAAGGAGVAGVRALGPTRERAVERGRDVIAGLGGVAQLPEGGRDIVDAAQNKLADRFSRSGIAIDAAAPRVGLTGLPQLLFGGDSAHVAAAAARPRAEIEDKIAALLELF